MAIPDASLLMLLIQDAEKRFARLRYVLEKSAVYSRILKAKMDEDKARQQEERERRKNASARKNVASTRKSTRRRGRKRRRVEDTDSDDDSDAGSSKRQKLDDDGNYVQELDEDDPPIFPQPKLVTGAKLKDYQLEGLQWMVSLDQNGISGILGVCCTCFNRTFLMFMICKSRRNGSWKGVFSSEFIFPFCLMDTS